MVKKELSPITERFLKTIPDDGRDSFTLEGGAYRVSFVHATRMVNEMRVELDLSQGEADVFGQAAMGVALFASTLRDRDTFRVSMAPAYSYPGFNIETSGSGEIHVGIERRPLIGKSKTPRRVICTRYISEWNKTFSHSLEPGADSIAGEFSRYGVQVEELATAMRLQVFFDRAGLVRGAAGLMIQAAWGKVDTLMPQLEEILFEHSELGKACASGIPGARIVHELFAAYHPQFSASRDLHLCMVDGCSFQEARKQAEESPTGF